MRDEEVCVPFVYGAVLTSTRTSGVATATLPYRGHLRLKRSMRSVPAACDTPVN